MNHFVKIKLAFVALIIGVFCAPIICCAKEEKESVPLYASDIEDGTYEAEVESSSSMFRVVKAVLHVSDGSMTADLTLSGTGYLKLFMGTGEEALSAGEESYIPFVEDAKGAYTYTIPVEALNTEFDCAAYSRRKERWYDRQLVITVPALSKEGASGDLSDKASESTLANLEGDYTIEVSLLGGTGRADVSSPVHMTVSDGRAVARLEWSSPNYDYMLVEGQKYSPVNKEGNSVFEIPVPALDQEFPVTADTIAMSEPHEIEYSLTFHSDTLRKESSGRAAAAMAGIGAAVLLAAAGAFMWMRKHRKKGTLMLVFCLAVFMTTGCGMSVDGGKENETEKSPKAGDKEISSELHYEKSMDLQYAEEFSVDYYEEGYAFVSVADGRKYLIIPEGKNKPEDLAGDIVIINRPADHIYLVATAVMDMMRELNALEYVRFSSQKADDWCMEDVREEMEKGNILYAGKYSAPDYERIVSEGCSLAIENNMISHSPEVIEKMEDFGIPVLVDLSSYEKHPLGRVEWIKLYGVLLGKEEEAKEAFDEQVRLMEHAAAGEASGRSVAFFFITNNGMVNVKVSSDYIPKMIELAGGEYIFEDLGEENSSRSSVTMQMEEFYHAAKEADYLIYNSTIDGEMDSLEELLEKEALLEDFKAVQEGNVWCTTRNLYQQSMSVGQMTEDIYSMLSGEKEEQEKMRYLYPLR